MRGLRWFLPICFALVSIAFSAQKVVFTGNLSLNGNGIDADSAKLYM
jgi:hypothetical protein